MRLVYYILFTPSLCLARRDLRCIIRVKSNEKMFDLVPSGSHICNILLQAAKIVAFLAISEDHASSRFFIHKDVGTPIALQA